MLAAAQLSAERRRIRRLLAILDDVATYTAAYADTRLLGQAWARVSELMLQADQLAGRCAEHGRCAVVRAIDRAASQEVGSPAWWREVRAAGRISDVHFSELISDKI